MTLFTGHWYGYTAPAASYPPEPQGEYITLDKFRRDFDGDPLLDVTFGAEFTGPGYAPYAGVLPSFLEFIIVWTVAVSPDHTAQIDVKVLPPGGIEAETSPEEVGWTPPETGPPGRIFLPFAAFVDITGQPLQLPPAWDDQPTYWPWADIVARTGFLLEAKPGPGALWINSPSDDVATLRARAIYDVTIDAGPGPGGGSLLLGSALSGVVRDQRRLGLRTAR